MLRTILKWTGIAVAGVIGLVLVVAAIGATYEAVASPGDAMRYPPPGRLVDIGGYRLHIHCLGTGSPAVIFDAGLGGYSLDWTLVHAPIAKFTRACAYDRAGTGWSDAGPKPRDAKQIATELHTLLHNAKIAAPYVLVGHSLGGKNVRYFALAYPDEVAGMVLVDARNELLDFHTSKAEAQTEADQVRSQIKLFGYARDLGLIRLIGGTQVNTPMPYATRAMSAILLTKPKSFDAVTAEAEDRADNDVALRDAPTLGDKPLVVLAAQQTMDALPDWRAGQKLQAALSSNSRFTLAKGSSHYIQYDRPALVIDAVHEVVTKVRAH